MASDSRTRGIVSALSRHLSELSIDPKIFSGESIAGPDIASLFTNILQLSENKDSLKNKDEVLKWVTYANSFPTEDESCYSSLKDLNEYLSQRAVLVGDGLKTSEADIIVFSVLHSFVSHLSDSDIQKVPNVMRWMDYIQHKEDFGGAFEKIVVKKSGFEPHFSKSVDKVDVELNEKKTTKDLKNIVKVQVDPDPKKDVTEKKASGDSRLAQEKKKITEKESIEKETEVSVTVLNIQVGVIRKAWKHPSADSLLVEEIDLGGGNLRQVVSGLAKYYSPDDLVNRHVVLITNVKPGKLRDVMSAGLVLCASNQDHTNVEPLLPPEGAVIGEQISFSGYEGKPEDVLNPKKKQLEKITPHLYTDDKGVATYKGISFMTCAGPCTSTISNAGIK